MGCCPLCQSYSVIMQDFDALANAVCQVKLTARAQLLCEACGWISFDCVDEFDCAVLELAM